MHIKNYQSDDLSNLLQLSMENLNYPSKKITQYMFIIEEALAKWKRELNPESELTFGREDTEKDVVFTFTVMDSKLDPFSREALSDYEKPIRTMHDKLLSGIGTELRYQYRSGINKIILRLPKNDIEDTLFKRTALTYIIPIALQILLQNIASNVDIIMLGFLSSDDMSGVSFASQLVLIHTFLVLCASSAVTSLLSQFWSKRRGSSALYSFWVAVTVSSILCFFEFIVCFFFPKQLLGIYTNIPHLIDCGSKYLKIVAISFLFDSFYATFYTFLRVVNDKGVVTKFIIAGCATNVLLNLLLIFGFLGLPRMGVAGAAIATVLSCALQLILAAIYYLKNIAYYRFDATGANVNTENIKKVFLSNFSTITMQIAAYLVGTNFCAAAIGRMNPECIAAYSFVNAINAHILCAKEGCAQAGGILTGIQLGRNNFDRARHEHDIMIKIAAYVGIVATILLFVIVISSQYLPIKLSEEAKQYLIPFALVIGINSFFGFINATQNNALYAGGEAQVVFYIDLANAIFISIPVSIISIMTGIFPPILLVLLCRIDEIITVGFKSLFVRKGKWLRNIVD